MKAIICKKIIPVTKNEIDNGFILMNDKGKIEKIGKEKDVPKDVEIIDAKNLVAFPGIVDPHCHATVMEESIGLGLQDGNETTDPITPFVRVLDAMNPMDKGLRRAIAGGITTICVAPGSGNVVGGQMTTIKTYGKIIDDMMLQENAGIKCAFGENPKRVYGSRNQMPSTRMGSLGLFRKLLLETQNYIEKWEEYEQQKEDYQEALNKYKQKKETQKKKKPKKPKKPETNIIHESMIPVMNKDVPLRAHAH